MIARIATFPTLPAGVSAEVHRNVLDRFMPALRAQDGFVAGYWLADAAGTWISQSYLTSIDSPENKAFIAGLQKKFGADLKTPNDLSEPEYDGIYLYKAAVEKAGSVDPDKVLKALPEVSFTGARGKVTMDKEHHAALTMYLGQVAEDGSVKVIEKFPNVSPGNQCPKLK